MNGPRPADWDNRSRPDPRLTPATTRSAIATLYEAATGRGPGDPVSCAACGARHSRRCVVDFTVAPGGPRHLLAALCGACEGRGAWDDLKRAEAGILARGPRKFRVETGDDLLLLVVDPDGHGPAPRQGEP